MTKRTLMTLFSLLPFLMMIGTASAHPPGKDDYVADCARCHGLDGKGVVPEMSAVRGYVSVDLTRLSAAHAGQFPRQEVYDSIDGRKSLVRIEQVIAIEASTSHTRRPP